MSKQDQNWKALIEGYKVSGLSQPDFCKQNNVSYNQFQYRWYLHNKEKKALSRLDVIERPTSNDFETVTLSTPRLTTPKESYFAELTIHLPNQISLDIKSEINNNEFAALLKQLVVLC